MAGYGCQAMNVCVCGGGGAAAGGGGWERYR